MCSDFKCIIDCDGKTEVPEPFFGKRVEKFHVAGETAILFRAAAVADALGITTSAVSLSSSPECLLLFNLSIS